MELSRYYFSGLNFAEQLACRDLADAMEQGKDSVKLSLLPADASMDRILKAIQYEHPELFFVDFSRMSYSCTPSSVTVRPRYKAQTEPLRIVRDKVSREIERIVSEANRDAPQSEQSKCRWIHNYLLKNVRYQSEALYHPQKFPQAFGIDGVFLNRAAVCDGISKAFQILCRRLGLSAMTVRGTSTLPQSAPIQSHAWNVVSVRGNPVHVDVTWDNNLSASSRHTRYDYFCVPDAWMERDHTFSDVPSCTADGFSYFAGKNVCFSSSRQLKAYLEEALRKKSRKLYFKLAGERLPANIVDRTNATVKRAVEKFSPDIRRVESFINRPQLCFFYRVTEEDTET